MSEFSKNLLRLRSEKKLSQEELAKRVGITQGAIWQYENGEATPKIAIAVSLASELGVTVEQLMKGES